MGKNTAVTGGKPRAKAVKETSTFASSFSQAMILASTPNISSLLLLELEIIGVTPSGAAAGDF